MSPFNNIRSKPFRCLILMPSGDDLECNVTNLSKGHVLLDYVCEKIGCTEKQYFGFKYVHHKDAKYTWLKLHKQLGKQLRSKYEVEFHVQFWPSSPFVVKYDVTRYQMVLETRRKILSGELTTTVPIQALLASFLVQAEQGDWKDNSDKTLKEDFKFFPDQPSNFQEQVKTFHQQNVGYAPSVAELMYLDNARKLSLHGVEMHPALDENHTSIVIGIHSEGILVLNNGAILNKILWSHVYKVRKKPPMLVIGLKMMTDGPKFNKLKVHFKSPTLQDLKRLYRKSHAQWLFHKEPENLINQESQPSFVRVNSKRFLKSSTDKRSVSVVPLNEGVKKDPYEVPRETSFAGPLKETDENTKPITVYVEPNEISLDSKTTEKKEINSPEDSRPLIADVNKNVEEVFEETRLSDKKFGSDLNVFDNLEKEDDVAKPVEDPKVSIETKPIRESIIGEILVKDKPLDEFDFTKEDSTDTDDESSDNEFEELKAPLQTEELSAEHSDGEEVDDLSEIEEIDEEISQDKGSENDSDIEELSVANSDAEGDTHEFVNEDSEGVSDEDNDAGDRFEEFTEHEIEASVNLNRENESENDASNSEDEEQDILVIEEVSPEGRLERSFSTNARSIQFSVSEAEDDTSSITQSYRQHHDWEALLNRSFNKSYERDERLLSVSHMSHASHMSHVSEVSKMSEKELLEGIDIDTVLVETTEYVTEEIDPETSNVTVVTHTTFTEIEAAEGVVGVTDDEIEKDQILLNQDSSVVVENVVY